MPDSQHEPKRDSGPRLVREQNEGYYSAHVDDALSREGLSLSVGTEGPGSDDAFWLPAGVVVAWADERLGDEARSVLESFVELRRWYGYCVVEEMTDDAVGLTVRAWPLIDDRGRLRFDVSEDSLSVVVSKSVFLEVVAAQRDRLFRVGLLDESLVERDVHYGDTFAVHPRAVEELTAGVDANTQHDQQPLMWDVTADARTSAKLALNAAYAGTVDTGRHRGLLEDAQAEAFAQLTSFLDTSDGSD